MCKILIVSSGEKNRRLLSAMVQDIQPAELTFAETAAAAHATLTEFVFDLILIDAKLSDSSGSKLALYAARQTSAGLLYIAAAGEPDTSPLEQAGVIVLERPIGQAQFRQAVRMAAAFRRRLSAWEEENRRLQTKISEIKLIDRAKCILIQYLNINEQQAHRYIEKQAMDRHRTRREIAEGILKTYES
ncbi:MAG: ANTAR domain-containing protein [Clostridia bacterium]|nr:ANTAR domain-containing protein [Clostridia bacterium]